MKFTVRTLWLAGMAILFTLSQASASECRGVNLAELEKLVGESASPGKMSSVVVFSSWCLGCREHIEKKSDSSVFYLAAFDKSERAAKTLRKFQPQSTCYLSQGIVEDLRIKTVPVTLHWNAKEKNFHVSHH